MEGNHNNAKTFLPELINRSRKLNVFNNESKNTSPFLLKVYDSKKKQISKLEEQIQVLEEHCDKIRQASKSTELKAKSMTTEVVFEMDRTGKMNGICQDLDQKSVQAVEQFENDMQKTDRLFIETMNNFSDANLPLLAGLVNEEIQKEEFGVNAIVYGNGDGSGRDDSLKKLARKLHVSVRVLRNEERHAEVSKKNPILKCKLAELEELVKELEIAVAQ